VTRIPFSDFRSVARSPGSPPDRSGTGFPTPHPVRQRAVRSYHREGLAAARQALDEGLSRYWSRPGGPATQARNTRRAFERYVSLDSADGREFAHLGLEHDVVAGAHSVGTRIDVVLFSPNDEGYDGRLLLWDTPRCTQELAELYAAPCVAAIDAVLGLPAQSMGVWQLRHRAEFEVDAEVARDRLGDVTTLLAQSL
jgi:hypothetical protein